MGGLTFQERIHMEDGRLGIAGVTLTDSGMYQCLAENEHGAIYASAELKVVGKSCFWLFAMHALLMSETVHSTCSVCSTPP